MAKCLTPSDPMDCSLPGSSIHGIFQARVLERVAIWGQCSPAGGVGKLFCKGSGVKYYRLVDQMGYSPLLLQH